MIFINKQILGFTACRFPFLLAFLHMATGGAGASCLVRRRAQAALDGGAVGAAAARAQPPSSKGTAPPKDLEAGTKCDDTTCCDRDDGDDDDDDDDGGASDDSSSTTAAPGPASRPPDGANAADASSVGLPRDYFLVAALLAGALLCANGGFMLLSIPMIQMLKAGSPAVTFFASVALGAEAFSAAQLLNVLVICAGVLCSAYASTELHLLGVGLQLAAIVCDSLRCSLLQRTMARAGAKMNPMAALAEFAPRAATLLVLPTLLVDAPVIWASPLCLLQSWHLIAASCAVAFLLNVAVCALIGATSALTTSVSGVLKDLACIVLAMVLHEVHITHLQWGGYAISLAGLAWHHYRNVFGRGAPVEAVTAALPAPTSDTVGSIGTRTELTAWRKRDASVEEVREDGEDEDAAPLLLERGGGGRRESDGGKDEPVQP